MKTTPKLIQISGIMSFTNNAGRARYSVRAATGKPALSAGRGLPALPILPSLFGKGIIPQICLLGALLLPAAFSEAQPVTKIAVGGGHSLFLRSDSSLWGMGLDSDDQLGGDVLRTFRPEQIVANGITAITAGEYYSLFLKSDGSLWAMGDNYSGQLGDGTYGGWKGTNRPEQIVASNVTAIAAGHDHSLFLKSDGSLWAMGYNASGQLGDGTLNNTNQPEQIVASNVTAIAAGGAHSLFLKSDGSLWGMGHNVYGQLGDGTYSTNVPYGINQPEQIVASNVTAIAAGGAHSLFLKSDGSLWAMGYNGSGQLGDGTYTTTNQPEQIVASNVTAIAAGTHSLFLKSDGSLWGMGAGTGISSITNLPEQIVASNVTAIAAGIGYSLFLKSDGSLWGMGLNVYGQLGDGTYNYAYLPEQINTEPPPALAISTYNNKPVVFFETATGTNFTLQMTTNLASGIWVKVTNGIPISAVQIPNAPGTAFFRLH